MINAEAQKGVLRLQIIAECDSLGNTNSVKTYTNGVNSLSNHSADYTSDNVPRNCSTVKTATIRQLVSTVQNVEYISASDLIDGKYLPAPLLQKLMAKHQKKAVLLRGGLGIGKSTALAALMAEFFNGKGVAICHRIGLTRQLCKTFDADYLGYDLGS